ncbi:MAG: PorV/PorQ family protein, partial [candidate division KSB1 bacterium]|nr:PorV/PorQ family protein [candidate division KSB1 bacterium]
MKRSTILLLAFLALIIHQAILPAQDIGSSGATFLKLGVGARPIGMGSAFSGLSDDVNAIYWNPAGLGFIKRWELSFTYQRLFADFNYQALFYSHQLRLLGSRKAALGFGLLRLGSLEEWDSTDGKMPAVAAGDVTDFAVILPFAYRFDWLSRNLAMGVNYKYVNNRLGEYSSNAHGVDCGLMFKTSLFDRLFWSLGTTVQNVTLKKVQFIHDAELLPFTLRAGSALKIFLTENQDLTLAYDVSRPRDNQLKHHFGFEYWLHLGIHRFGLRGGYRLIDQDLGKMALSIGYGLDVTPMARNSYFSEMDLGLNNYNPDILGNTELFSITLKPNSPEPFRRLLPEFDAQFTSETHYLLTWEESFDYDDHDRVEYLVVLDTSYAKIDSVKNNARKIIEALKHQPSWNGALFYRLTPGTSARFEYQRDVDFQTFYWAVIAYDRNLNITIATGSDEIGKFSNRNLPDIKPVALNFATASQFDTSKFQGELEAKFVGLIKKPCRVVIYDSTDARIICSGMIAQLAAADTFSLSGKWWADQLGSHRIAAIADFEQSIQERNETNNVLSRPFLTIPYGIVSVPDTIKLEELSYEHIELPTIPYIFFEPNSVDFSQNSRLDNETDPDSLLKLFGKRLQQDYPGLRIWLRGYIDPVSEQPVTGDRRLSYLRAEKVKQKLI